MEPGNVGTRTFFAMQTAFLVDRYLQENGFTETQRHFRNEASSLLSVAPVREVPELLIPLDYLVNEYVIFKALKTGLGQEQLKVNNLMQGMQNVMDTYKACAIPPYPLPLPPPPQAAIPPYPLPLPSPPPQAAAFGLQRSSGYAQYSTQTGIPASMYSTQTGVPASLLCNSGVGFGNFWTPPSTCQSISAKRKGPEVSVGAPWVSRRARIATAQEKLAANEMEKILQAKKDASNVLSRTPSETLINKSTTNELMTAQGQSLVNCLVNEADTCVPTNSSFVRAPSRRRSKGKAPQKEVNPPTKSTIDTKGKLAMSPVKECTAPEGDLFNQELYSTSFISGGNNSYTKLLEELDLHCEGATSFNAPTEAVSWLSAESRNVNLEPNQVMSGLTSNVNQVIQEQDMSTQGRSRGGGIRILPNPATGE